MNLLSAISQDCCLSLFLSNVEQFLRWCELLWEQLRARLGAAFLCLDLLCFSPLVSAGYRAPGKQCWEPSVLRKEALRVEFQEKCVAGSSPCPIFILCSLSESLWVCGLLEFPTLHNQ